MSHQHVAMTSGVIEVAIAITIVVGSAVSLIAPQMEGHWRDALWLALLAGPIGVIVLVESVQHPEHARRISKGNTVFALWLLVGAAIIIARGLH